MSNNAEKATAKSTDPTQQFIDAQNKTIAGLKKTITVLKNEIRGLKETLVKRDEEIAQMREKAAVDGDDIEKFLDSLQASYAATAALKEEKTVLQNSVRALQDDLGVYQTTFRTSAKRIQALEEENYKLLFEINKLRQINAVPTFVPPEYQQMQFPAMYGSYASIPFQPVMHPMGPYGPPMQPAPVDFSITGDRFEVVQAEEEPANHDNSQPEDQPQSKEDACVQPPSPSEEAPADTIPAKEEDEKPQDPVETLSRPSDDKIKRQREEKKERIRLEKLQKQAEKQAEAERQALEKAQAEEKKKQEQIQHQAEVQAKKEAEARRKAEEEAEAKRKAEADALRKEQKRAETEKRERNRAAKEAKRREEREKQWAAIPEQNRQEDAMKKKASEEVQQEAQQATQQAAKKEKPKKVEKSEELPVVNPGIIQEAIARLTLAKEQKKKQRVMEVAVLSLQSLCDSATAESAREFESIYRFRDGFNRIVQKRPDPDLKLVRPETSLQQFLAYFMAMEISTKVGNDVFSVNALDYPRVVLRCRVAELAGSPIESALVDGDVVSFWFETDELPALCFACFPRLVQALDLLAGPSYDAVRKEIASHFQEMQREAGDLCEALQMRECAEQRDAWGLPKYTIQTTKEPGSMTLPQITLVVWYIRGRLAYLAGM